MTSVQFHLDFIENGQFINGGEASITKEKTGNVNTEGVPFYNLTIELNSGVLFFDKQFVEIQKRTITLNDVLLFDSNFNLGVMTSYSEIDSLGDPSLVEPANNIRNYGQSGALRLKVTGEWNITSEVDESNDNYSVIWNVIEAIVQNEAKDPFTTAVIDVVSEYDNESRGNYLVEGYKVSFISKADYIGEFHFQMTEGKANVDGYKVTRDFTSEYIIPTMLDYELKQSEPTIFIKVMVNMK